jgi:hypothetical protein
VPAIVKRNEITGRYPAAEILKQGRAPSKLDNEINFRLDMRVRDNVTSITA